VSNKKKQSKGLGKGLGAIFPEIHSEEAESEESGKVVEIPLDQIAPNPRQPRKEFNQEKLEELADTIATHGVIQPVVVQKSGDGFILIAGERRVRASQIAGLTSIPALVKEYSSSELMEITLVENLQREDLNPIEEALAYHQLIEEFGLTQENLAKRLGRSRSAITNSLRLLTMADTLKHYLLEGKLTAGQIRPMLALESVKEQEELAKNAAKNQWSARKIEQIVKNSKDASKDKKEVKKEVNENEDPVQQMMQQELEEKIRRKYGTKVAIKKGVKEGKIELFYYGNDDLERLVSLLLNDEET